MPSYTYICNNCADLKQAVHSIDEVLTNCEVCKTENVLRRVPSGFTIAKHKEQLREEFNKNHKPGEIVKQSIDEIHGDVEAEREALKNRVFPGLTKK